MYNFKIKDFIFTISVSVLSFAAIYFWQISPKISPSVNQADIAFFMAVRFGLSILILIYPFKKIKTKIVAYTITVFVTGLFLPLVNLPDGGNLMYIIPFLFSLIIIVLGHLLINSRLSESRAIYALPFLFFITALYLIYITIPWTQYLVSRYSKFYVYDYIQCHPEDLSLEQYKNICENVSITDWHGNTTINVQSSCNKNVVDKELGVLKPIGCATLSKYSSNSNTEYKYSEFLSEYWKIKNKIGLPSYLH